jgi:hypothetical protein
MEPRLQGAGIIPGAHAETVNAGDEFGPFAGAQRVSVDSHDAGQGAPVGLQVGGGVVGLPFEDIGEFFIEPANAGVIPENGDHPGVFPGNLPGGSLDASLEGVIQDLA